MSSPSDPFSNKKVEIWADIKFVPADPKRQSSVITTKKTKLQKIIKHLKELRRFFK
jgi:hypothetical protein